MSAPLGTYSFLPWLRQGLANRITAADAPGGAALRASVARRARAHRRRSSTAATLTDRSRATSSCTGRAT